MAEGHEVEAAEEAEPAFDTGATAVALALDEARSHPSSRKEAAAFLAAQRGLVELQKHHLKSQFLQMRVRTAGDTMRLALQTISLLAVLALLVVIGQSVRDAMGAHGLAVEEFSTPPSFAARGVSGEVLAGDLGSRISAIARIADANSISRSENVRADAEDAVKLEIPETGLSLDEVTRYLHRSLGHERRIAGDLRDEGAGAVSLTVRMTGADPIVIRGPASDLDGLVQRAAEQTLAAFDPNYVIYLESQGRSDEALAAAGRFVNVPGSRAERADAYALWSNADGDSERGLRKALISISIDPTSMVAWMEAGRTSERLGHDEAAVAYARRGLKARAADQLRQQRSGFENVMAIDRVRIAHLTGDYAGLPAENPALVAPLASDYVANAQTAGLMHDPARAIRLLNDARAISEATRGDQVLARWSAVSRDQLVARWNAAAGAEDWAGALPIAQALVADAQSLPPSAERADAAELEGRLRTTYRPWLALALAMNGRLAEAAPLIGTTPLDCYLCVRVRARVAEAAGDRAGADRWFAEAARQGPSLPFAELERGNALIARGQPAAAIVAFQVAHTRSPRLADPLKGWGDALLRMGDRTAAAAKYDEALRLAPAWQQLRAARAALRRAAS